MSGPTESTKSLYALVLVEEIFELLNASGELSDEEIVAILERIRDLLKASRTDSARRALGYSERALLGMRDRE